MSNSQNRAGLDDLPVITSRDIAAHVREGKRLRDEEVSKLLRAAGRGLARLFRAATGSAASERHGAATRPPARGGFPSGGLASPTRS
jgi:hypothetical protein